MSEKRPRITFLLSLLSVFVLILSLSTFVSAKPRKKSKKRKETAEQRIARKNREAALRQAILMSMSAAQANAVNGAMDVNSGRDTNVRASAAPSGSLALFVPDPEASVAPITPAAGSLVISEFRLRGPSGANDEFIEIYNDSAVSHTVTAISGTGYAIAASDGAVRCTIPNATVIPARGHFLCVNSTAYSLASY